ncbi:MAG: trypsin-like peptidase domain-containing protein [Chloracidobacterium sp.]|nr:trypsin-like peptidase domain-containing protein [Chloracidobacterium sp.]MCC6826167.1 trypsin-like peptidase domain-containing protein [Acidobacteriota bacterium]MCO5333267.1 serine protease [Pyrinomonadaceae bacterium]
MALGIVIHISTGTEKRTEFFSQEHIRIGADETCDLQVNLPNGGPAGVWLDLENADGVYRVINFDEAMGVSVNDKPIRRYIALTDGDRVAMGDTGVEFAFFALESRSSLIRTGRDRSHIAQFIEEAALESSSSAKRDDAKAFLREFTRELAREISWTTKAIVMVLLAGFITGVVYIGYAINRQLTESRNTANSQADLIRRLEGELQKTGDKIGELNKSNEDLIKTVSLAPNLRVEYGGAVGLIVGVYDIVDKRTGKVLRYADPQSLKPNPYEPPSEDPGHPSYPNAIGITTEGSGSPIEYDFIGTGFHVGGGYIVTNRHVVQPWEEDDQVKQIMAVGNGKPRVKKLVLYFPRYAQPFPLKVRQLGSREDLAIASIDPAILPSDLPIIPLDPDSTSAAIGKTVVTMGYPSGPDRLLAMIDDDQAKSINQRFGNSRVALIDFLAQSQKIVPLTTQGLITDLDANRIVHDAKTAEGGSGAPLFGQAGKVIGVNFGVFTENTAANMAVPVKFAVDLLRKAGWQPPEESNKESEPVTTPPETAAH